ncbi:hypothetical protein AMR41_08595 [Hapalosiphon sp. MRB220]|nr:hypothetical protein AMR41_08595 [Hapalosiphon sp. MRB220]
MQAILARIDAKKKDLTKAKFFQFLQDKNIHPRQRMAWVPCYAPLAMSFADLNKYFLRKEPTNSEIQEIINKQTYEEATHYVWFLHDLQALEFDQPQPLSDTLKFLWGEETQKIRLTCTQIATMTANADPAIVLVAIEAIEATAHIIFTHTRQVARELQQITNQKCYFFGDSHSNVETGHAIGATDMEDFLRSIQLSQRQSIHAIDIVEKIFTIVEEFLDELVKYAENHPIAHKLNVT